MEYTKGKLDVSTHADNNDVVVRSQKGIIANCSCDTSDLVSPEERVANAQLFASAPELLEALKDLVEIVENLMGCSFWEHSKDDDELLKEAKAAIKKATTL